MSNNDKDFARFNVTPVTVKKLRELGLGDDEIRSLSDILCKNFEDQNKNALTNRVSLFLNTISRRYHSMRTRSLYQWNCNPELTRLSMIRLYIAQEGKCYHNPAIILTFIDQDDVFGKNHMLSTERLDQSEIYTLQNTVFCSMQYQTSKQMTAPVLKALINGARNAVEIPELAKENWNTREVKKVFKQLLWNISPRCATKRRRRYLQKLKALRYWRKMHPLKNSLRSAAKDDDSAIFEEIAIEDDYRNYHGKEGEDNSDDSEEDEREVAENEEVMNMDRAVNGRKSNPECFIDFAFLRDCFNRQKGRCYYSGHPLMLESGSPFSASIERIDNNGDHTEENCVLVCTIMQAPLVKWTKELFSRDHNRWINRLDKFEAQCKKMQQDHDLYVKSSPLGNRCEIAFYPYSSGITPPDGSYKIPRVVHISKGAICQFCGLKLSNVKALTEHKRQLHPMTLLTCPVISCRLIHNKESEERKDDDGNSDHYIFDKVHLLLNHYVTKHVDSDTKVPCPVQGCRGGPFQKTTLCKHLCKIPKPEREGKKKTPKQLARVKSHTEEEKYLAAERLYVENGTRHAFTPLDRGRKTDGKKNRVQKAKTGDTKTNRRSITNAKPTGLQKKRKRAQSTKDTDPQKKHKGAPKTSKSNQ